MRLNLTPAMMEAAYELLRASAPFRGWRLPEPDDILFKVYSTRDAHAHFEIINGVACIGVKQASAKTLNALLMHMGHEMIHLRQWCVGVPQTHGTYYQDMKRAVCSHHGFDPGIF